MKKITLAFLIAVLCMAFASCGSQENTADPGSDPGNTVDLGNNSGNTAKQANDLADTQWAWGDMTVSFDGNGTYTESLNDMEFNGRYELYTDEATVSKYSKRYDDCQPFLKDQFEEESATLSDAVPMVLIVDMEGNPSDAETGMETHFEYYGLHSEDKIVMCEPDPHNYSDVMVLVRK